MHFAENLKILNIPTLPNFPASTSLGTSATTVDLSSYIQIQQSTPNVILNISIPTDATAGRLLLVENTGSVSVIIQGRRLAPTTGMIFIWNGVAWRAYSTVRQQNSVIGYSNPGSAANYSPNSGLNTIISGVSTMPADTITYGLADGNFVGTLSLPTAVGRVGGLSVYSIASSSLTIVHTNTDLDSNTTLSTGRSLHFVSDGAIWRWVEAPYLYPDGQKVSKVLVIAGNTTLNLTHDTVIIPLGSAFTVTLPSSVGIIGRVYTITNNSAVAKTIGAYTNLAGVAVTTIAAASTIRVISIGTAWHQI